MARKTLTLHLAKADVQDFDAVFSEETQRKLDAPSTLRQDVPDFGDGGRLYVFVGGGREPPWLGDLRGHFQIALRVETRSAAAVLAFRSAGRLFVSTFAHGWMYLDDTQFEGDFGLRVALNAVDDAKLKRLERANLADALRGVAQSPFQRDLASFGIDDALDLIRTISGTAKDDASADTLTGSRALKASGEFSLADLPDMATEALTFYGSDDYQQTPFKVVDWVQPVDARLAVVLDEEAVASIKSPNPEFELGVPLGYDDDVASFSFVGAGLPLEHPDLLLRHYTEALGRRLQAITADTLRAHKIVASFQDNRPPQKLSIRKALVGSLEYQTIRYAINDGEWYRVDAPFKRSIEENYDGIVEHWDVAPEPLRKIYDADGNGHYEAELQYNTRLARTLGFICLDTRLITLPDVERSAFEACDLLDIAGKRFIHVKKSSRQSSVLSHFFKQGANSAKQFRILTSAWIGLEAMVEEVAGQEALAALRAARADPLPWKVEFVIADAPRADGRFNIPFFSKISLRDEVINLRAWQYRVGLKFVRLDPGNPVRPRRAG